MHRHEKGSFYQKSSEKMAGLCSLLSGGAILQAVEKARRQAAYSAWQVVFLLEVPIR
jgi:hypothetical protein